MNHHQNNESPSKQCVQTTLTNLETRNRSYCKSI